MTLIVGKGGVGKTTCAAALALRSSKSHGDTLVLSTDPARALPTVFGQPIGADPTPIRGSRKLMAQSLDAMRERAAFMERWGGVIRTILDRGTYLDDEDIGPLVDTALPGADEIFSALALARLMNDAHKGAEKGAEEGAYNRIVVDTAPTGHTLRLLNLPKTFRALVRLLEAMQEKHRYMVRALTRRYRADEADAFLREMTHLVSALDAALKDPAVTAAIMVSNPEPLVMDETRRYLGELAQLRVHVAAVVWNGVVAGPRVGISDMDQYVVPRLDEWPVGTRGLETWLEAMRALDGPVRRGRTAKRPSRTRARLEPTGRAEIAALARPLTIVAGKGGVGKTTVATAIAIAAAEKRRTLLVSTDPAPSLADALAQPIPDADTNVAGVPRLFARQMDASSAFARLRDDYQSRADALFDALVGRGMDLSHDRAIVRDLLSLAPPGIDEVYALSLLSDALFKDTYECVVADPAPTGHLLRLLEMPQLALSWTHQLMRLMLKYKDVAGLGDTARDLLDFARRLRALDALVRDASRCGVVLVTLDEPVVRAESERLEQELVARGVALAGEVLNRAGAKTLPVSHAPVHFLGPLVDPPPVGVAAIRLWSRAFTSHD